MFPILETDRLVLREIQKDDAGSLFSCFSNENVMRFYGQEAIERLEQAEEFVDLFANIYKGKKGIRWGIERKDTKELIGTIGFNSWNSNHKRAEIGYEIHPDHWRKGYTYEALEKVVPFGFKELGLTRLGAIVFTDNTASAKLLDKAGFQREGILRNFIYQKDKAYDTYVYSLLPNNE